MSKFYLIIEGFINKLLLIFYHKLKAKLAIITPAFIRNGINRIDHLIRISQDKGQSLLSRCENYCGNKIAVLMLSIRKWPLKENLAILIAFKTEHLSKIKELTAKGKLLYISELLRLALHHFWVFFKGLNHLKWAPRIVALFLLVGGPYFYYHEHAHRQHLSRAPTSVRPSYYKLDSKYATLLWFYLPIFQDAVSSIKALKADFVIEGPNRLVIQYLAVREHEIRDYLNTVLEPVAPQFPLTDEGKRIIKNKVQMALNRLLYEKKIQGFITHVYISEIMVD